MPAIRPFRPGDEPALSDVCRRTADAGADATGLLDDDKLWGEVFVLPYVARHPDLAFVVEGEEGSVLGYVVGTDDTRAFEEWFRTVWWPRFAERWTAPSMPLASGGTRQDDILRYAADRGETDDPYADVYPAHLHIDLLPELQGLGFGPRLIDTLVDALRTRGVAGLHLVTDARNAAGISFFSRRGFTRVASPPGGVAFGRQI